ncbi:ROOT HAIR defective 3 GTP-binding protein (macronuclear) [Tetrahymena thermophila SB210]|uniref:Protein SEY1 homolog n=1 Tax=Tetrahymena thermophila (strain SB210) TaxID=312017 RepID=I7MKN2_TETTS|nr:ROOT HAIR defective 3 GTP-binding protein [Tetrahymena thermophila SB210]EAR99602.2 ROOT HAIR defective 3 GTP-binding protein [Tetrahymena thermophila SB210]|eukprot:XP_001019847.2 ROOT HAIR defective 3 GTP-binding protein [Tetrahymena thermophila SB210]
MSEQSQNQYHHLIDDQCQLIPGLTNFIRQSGLGQSHNSYNIVSIIGSQNSGKSTLLNRVFGTNFQMLSGSSRTQTTKGIWVSRDKEQNILILDVEGSNSRQRGKAEKGSEFYERSTALFALAFSQILIINCNSLNLGHESEYSIIKIIMEMNIRLFRSDQVKQMLIIIRDFNDEVDNFKEVTESIRNEIYGIWGEIQKPPEFANVQPEQIFKIDFFTSSHFQYQRQKFESDMVQLRDRFINPGNPFNLFKGYNYNTNIPIEALEDLATTLWDTIQKNEDLNLPNQKLQASQVRCLKIKDQAIDLINQDLQKLKQDAESNYLTNFNERAQNIVTRSLHHYDTESQYYVEKIKLEMRKVLNDELKTALYPIFNQQITSLQQNIKNELKNNLDALDSRNTSFIKYMDDLSFIRQQIKQVILQGLHQSLPFNEYKVDWEITKIDSQLSKVLEEIINNAREIQFVKYINSQEKTIKNSIDNLISNCFDTLDLEFWTTIRSGFNQILKENETRIRDQISQFFDHSRVDKEMNNIIHQSHQFLQDDIQKKIRELSYYLLKRFKRTFLKDEKGLTRKWKELEEPVIQQLFLDSRKSIEDILQEFTRFKVSPPQSHQFSARMSNMFSSEIVGRAQMNDEVRQAKQSLDFSSEDFSVLLDTSQINKIKQQFIDESEEEYNQVLRQRNTSFNTNVPKWMWVVLVFFMYDDVLRWMANPLLLYPIILLGSFIGLCVATGYQSIPKVLFQQIFGQLTTLLGPLLLKIK